MNGVTLVTLSLLLAYAAGPDPDSKKPTTITKPTRGETKATPQPPKKPHLGVVRAVGIGKPPRRMRGAQAKLMARRAAEVRAVRNLAIKLGYGRRATVRGFRYVSTEYLVDGSVRVMVEIPCSVVKHQPRTKNSSVRSTNVRDRIGVGQFSEHRARARWHVGAECPQAGACGSDSVYPSRR